MLKKLLNETTSKQSVFVCKKNKDIINNLVEFIQAYLPFNNHCILCIDFTSKCNITDKVALIDDEADDSVNTKAERDNFTLLYSALRDLYNACSNRYD